MIKRNLTKREVIILGIAIVIVTVYFGYDQAFLKLQEDKGGLKNDIRIAEGELLRTLREIKLGNVKDAQYKRTLSKFRQGVSNDQAMSSILAEIEQIANESNMSISQMKPEKVKQVDFSNHFAVNLRVDGSLTNIMKFLYTLQSDGHLFRIDKIEISRISPRLANLRCRFVASKVLIP